MTKKQKENYSLWALKKELIDYRKKLVQVKQDIALDKKMLYTLYTADYEKFKKECEIIIENLSEAIGVLKFN